jgi:DNA-binding PucR family transcriptional regulator
MGLYRLLIGIDDPEILEDYYSQSLSCLVEYDREYHSNLLETLRAYFDNNCSVKETAEQLYVHRNTVNYKLGRIEEVTGLSLASTQTRLQLTLALMISDMITT